uniref:Centromere-associated protein E-like n=1 Tax=Callorhinchus milii TaxID=7868 RepID=A0A4W3IC29_CALMI
MKEEMNEMRMNYQQMEKDTQLYRNQLDAERTRYNQMQTDMQKELQHVFIENTKLTTLMDGKVPKNLLDCVQLEKTISELQQQLAKTSEEKTCLQQEVNRLCECKSLPDEVEKLTTPMAESATELCILTEEKDKLLAEREEYKNKYEELTIAKGQLYEELMAAQSRLKESKHELNGLNNQCKQLQLQLSTVVQETDQMERDLTGLSSEKDELRNDKQEKRYQDGCGNRILENECLNPDQSTVIEARNEIEVKELKEQLYSLQQNMNTLRTEKEQLQQERASLQTESEQMKCDLQESIEMAVENQAEMRNLQEELKVNQKNEIELKQSLSEKDHTINKEKQKTLECKNELQQVVSQRDHLLIEVEQLRCELINNVSKAQILDQEFNHQVQQLENAKSSVVLEKDELQHKLESVQSQRDAMEKTLCEKVEMVVTTERRNQEQAELVSVLEKQIATLKQRLVDSETSQSENNGIETDLSCHLQEKELLLQSTTQDFVEIKSKYSLRLSNSDKELSQEREKWRDLLAGFLSEATENVTLSKTIEELQRENLELHEQYQTWSLKFTISLSTVPYHQNKFVTLITKIDADLVKEHREQKELLVQLRALNSDSANLPLPDCEERNSEIRRLSSLLENKEQQLQETKQNLSELDSKYQNYLTITETELQFEINARKELLNHSSNHSSGNISSTIERIKHENKRLQEETELLKKTVLSTVKIFSPMWDSRNKFIINSNLQLADQRRKNKELLLQIQALRERESTENRCDPLQTVEDQELPRKFEQAIQDREMKIGKLEIALEMSREKCKLQENKILALQTEFSSKPLDKKVEALQAELVRKNDQIQDLLKATTQLQVSVDKCTEPFKQEIIDLKNRCSKLDLEKISETKRLEQQVSSLTASSRHKDELLGNMKRELRRNQTQQNISYVDQTEEAICSSDSPTTCGSGSGIVQSALVLVLQSENAKLEREVTQLRRKNQSLSSSAAEWEGEIRKWKGKLARKEEVRALDLKSEDVNVPSTLLLPLKQQTSSPQKVPPSVEVSTSFQGQTQSFDSSESRFFNLESQSRLSHPSKFFDNSGLGSLAGESPQKNPEKNDRKDWWKKSSSAAANDVQCKTQ